MPKKNAKSKRGDAERAVEWFVRDYLGCIDSVRAVRTQWQRQDLFGCDCVGKFKDGSKAWVQVTAGGHSAVTSRRRKLETVWHDSDAVYVAQLVQTEDPANARRKLWFFRIHEYGFVSRPDRSWETWNDAILVPKQWFTAYKNKQQKE